MRAGDLVGGRFRLTREAGQGGMGTVFQAVDLERGSLPVAVKVMRRDEDAFDAVTSGRFAREIELLAALDDPRIVRYVASGQVDGRPWLAEEWLDGCSLAEQLDGDGLTLDESIGVAVEVAGGLAVAHRAGIVHRDVKPENIVLVDGDPADIKLIDFGIARREDEPHLLTRTGTFVGTPGYISPEQARGDHDIDARSDVFALGCILYECLTGRPPFTGRSLTAIRTKVLLYDPPPVVRVLPELPAELSDALATLMAKERPLRPPGGAEAAALLRPFVGALAGERGVRSVTLAAPTQVSGALACMVIASADAGRAAEVAAAVQPYAGRVQALPGRTLLITPPPELPALEQLVCAAHCALAARTLIDGPIVLTGWVAGGTPGEALAGAIDRGAATLTTLAVSEGGTRHDSGAGPVRVDAALVALLEPRFELLRETDGSARMHGPRDSR